MRQRLLPRQMLLARAAICGPAMAVWLNGPGATIRPNAAAAFAVFQTPRFDLRARVAREANIRID